MEIHKIKPIHNWRDFLKELGTIVLGICVAIGLEQLVETWHWGHQVTNARRALHSEISTNNANFPIRRLSYKPCLDRQTREAEEILADLEAARQPRRFTSFHSTNGGPTTDGEWQAQRAAQTLTHFPESELATMSRYYAWLADFKDWNSREAEAWTDLSILRNPPTGLGPSDFMRLRMSLAYVKRYDGLIYLNAERVLNLTDTLGVPRKPFDQNRLSFYCNSSEEEYLERIRSMDP